MNFPIVRILIAAFAMVAVARPAQAEWHEASSDHFVIYADDKERDIRQFAENLERYHSAMAFLTGRQLEKPSPSSRVTIYVVGSQRDIRNLAGGKNRNVAGFYIPRAGGSRAFVQEIRNQDGYPDFSTIVLLHEYAHHFLMSSSRFAMPRWLNEGAAEFFAAATFKDDGSLLIGRAAQHRGAELARAAPVHVRDLLNAGGYADSDNNRRTAFYGKSWLLYHYLTFSQDREGQLRAYQIKLLEGAAPLEAGEAVFGDLNTLERELKVYLRGRFMNFSLGSDKLSIGTITLRQLPPGEAEMLPLQIRSQRGVNREQALEILPEVRVVAARHPADAGVLAALAEAEYDAGNDAEAIDAADRAIALDPQRANPYVQKGFALFRQARDAADKAAAYKAAMEPFTALNAMENDHPLPLVFYYRSYAERGAVPPENARAALERAAMLAPFDHRLQLNAGMMLIKEGKFDIAGDFLAPVAVNPHGGGAAARAKTLMEVIAKAPPGAAIDLGPEPEAEDEAAAPPDAAD